MANSGHIIILKEGTRAWNEFRRQNPKIIPFLSRANLRDENLNGANLSGAKLYGADLSRAHLRGANLSSASLSGANLSGANLSGANLRSANLRHINLSRANLSHSNLCNAYLVHADLTKANLKGANLQGANLRRASLRSANLSGAILAGEPLQTAANLTKSDLHKTIFTPLGSPIGGSSFLDLASCYGIESANFSELSFLKDYLARAFEYAHQPDIPEAKKWPHLFERAIKNIKALRTLYSDKQPPKKLIEVVYVITFELIKYLKKHPKEMYQIKPRQFEELIAEIFASYNWNVQLTPPTKDGGYDILAISKDIKPGVQSSWIIECKKYSSENKVGVDIVRALYGIKSNLKVANALLATTSYFTKGAKDFKASRYDIELKDYHNIIEWINQYRPNPNGKLYIKNNKLILPNED